MPSSKRIHYMDTQHLITLLAAARHYLDDPRLYRNECDGRRRRETKQDHADRLSAWMQENEDLRNLIERIDNPSTI